MNAFDPNILPAEFRSQHWDKWTNEERVKWLGYRQQAQTDPMYLAVKVLGWDFQENPHRGMFREFLQMNPGVPLYDLDVRVKKRMILWPRGTFKTSAVIVQIIQLIINYPDIRILIMQGSAPLAKRQLARVKKIFESHIKFAQLFPEFCGDRLGNAEEFTVPNRSANCPFAEPTCAISTAKSVKAGSHFDVIFVDDLVNDQNYKSAAALDKTIEDYKDIGPVLEPAGFLFVTGTRYSFGDTYEHIQERAKEEMKQTGKTVWRFSIRTCWIKFCATCKHPDTVHNFDKNYKRPPCTEAKCECTCFVDSGEKQVLFPLAKTKDGRQVGHTVEFLESEKIDKGEEFFACQYENNPIAAGTQTFTPELIDAQTLYHLHQLPSAAVAPTFIVGDLSYVGADHRDKSVLYVCRLFQGQIFVIECISGKWDTGELTNQLFMAMWTYRPRIIWLERFLGWEAYNAFFEAFASTKGIQRMPVEWIPMSNALGAKTIRIGTIKAPLEQKRLWLFAGMNNFEDLLKQLKQFPKQGYHDDYSDCLGLVVAVPSGYQMTSAPKKDIYKSFLGKPQEEKEQEAVDGGCGSGILC